jgi:transcriptional regulator with XRE-family HTH domain
MDFADWLQKELDKRDWSQAKLAKNAGINRTGINKIINRSHKTNPSPETLEAIAKALKIPADEVYRHAGILPPVSEQDSQDELAQYLFDQLNDDNKTKALEYLEFLKQQESKGGKNAQTKPRTVQT